MSYRRPSSIKIANLSRGQKIPTTTLRTDRNQVLLIFMACRDSRRGEFVREFATGRASGQPLMSAFGPKRTSLVAPHMSAFGGKADMTVCGSPLSRSLLGVKRTFAAKFIVTHNSLAARGFQSFRLIGISDKICAVKRCVFERVPCSVATSFLFSPAR